MPLIAAHEVEIDQSNQAIYNGLDAALTFEVDQARQNLHQNDTLIYDFERAMQGPALEMMTRGFRVDIAERENAIGATTRRKADTSRIIEYIVRAIQNGTYNAKFPNSPTQLQALFYDRMKLKPIERHENGETKRPMNRETLERLALQDKWAEPLINAILFHRDLTKTLQVLETEIDDRSKPSDPFNWRWCCSYNIGGTKTGRWSSSKSPLGDGNNFQNINEELRRIFVPDPGYKLYGIDKAQSEAHDVGWFCGTVLGDWSYLDMCQSGDLHTSVTRLLYPEWEWTGDLKRDRALAERRFYRTFTFRDASKRVGHACLTEDHEVLTRKGWVSIESKPEEILQWKEGESRFAKVSNWADFEYSGTLHEFDGRNLSAHMTENHKIPFKSDRRTYGIKTKAAVDGPGKLMPLGEDFVGGTENVPARLIAAFMSDGSQSSSKTMDFQFKKERKATRLVELCDLYGFEIKSGIGRENVFRFYVKGNLPKKAGAFMLNWNIKCIKDFLDEYKNWDGHTNENSQQTLLYSVDRDHLDWIKTLGRICGIGGAIWNEIIKNSYSGNTELFILSQNDRLFATNSGIDWIKNEVVKVRVLCPTVPSGFFYIRRKGKISITGNSNYMGQPTEISKQTHVPLELVKEFQRRYFIAFPCIQKMHQWIASQLQRERYLVNSFGRRRDFFDRPDAHDTLKGAVAYMFQSATGDCLNLGLYRLWKKMGTEVQILSQLHDAVYFQYPICSEAEEQSMLRRAIDCVQIEQTYPGINGQRKMVIPGEVVGGFNWSHKFRLREDGSKEEWNPRGLTGITVN